MIERTLLNAIWDSKAEYYAYQFLKQHLNSEFYEIHPHIVLRDIFNDLDEEIKNQHIDLLITTNLGEPVLGIEINGNQHQNNKKIKAKDQRKQLLFSSISVPLIFIPLAEIPKYDKEMYTEMYLLQLEDMLKTFLKPFCYHISIPVYCSKCGKIMEFYYNSNYTGKFYRCNTCTNDSKPDKLFTIDCSKVSMPFIFDKEEVKQE